MTSSTSSVVLLEQIQRQHGVQLYLFNCSDFVHNLCSIGDLGVRNGEPEVLLLWCEANFLKDTLIVFYIL